MGWTSSLLAWNICEPQSSYGTPTYPGCIWLCCLPLALTGLPCLAIRVEAAPRSTATWWTKTGWGVGWGWAEWNWQVLGGGTGRRGGKRRWNHFSKLKKKKEKGKEKKQWWNQRPLKAPENGNFVASCSNYSYKTRAYLCTLFCNEILGKEVTIYWVKVASGSR